MAGLLTSDARLLNRKQIRANSSNTIPKEFREYSIRPTLKRKGGFFFRTQTCVDKVSFDLYSAWGGHDKLRKFLLSRDISKIPTVAELEAHPHSSIDTRAPLTCKIQCPMGPEEFKIFNALNTRFWLRAFLRSEFFYKELINSGLIPKNGFIKLDKASLDSQKPRVLLKFLQEHVSCGFPSPALDYTTDDIDLMGYLCPNPAATILIRAEGDSMLDAGISPGDMLIIDRSLEARAGNIVIASAAGEFTVKRLIKKGATYALHPENLEKNYPDIVPNEFVEIQILGVVRHAIKSFQI